MAIALWVVFWGNFYWFIVREALDMLVPWFVITAITFVISYISLMMCAFSEPGLVPTFVSMYIQNDSSARIYCTKCHNFKPERSHHCSHCRKCVLNMDHHCPWTNNCIGFQNRKYFLQFIGYLLVAIGVAFVPMVTVFIR